MLHQRRDLARLARVRLVLHELSCFSREAGAAPVALGSLGDGLARGLGAADPPAARDLVELPDAIAPEPQGERGWNSCHVVAV